MRAAAVAGAQNRQAFGDKSQRRISMSSINSRKITTKIIGATYDLALAHFKADPDLIPNDTTCEDHVQTVLQMRLKELSYERAGNLPAMIRSHVAKTKRTNAAPATAADACDITAQLFKDLTGTALERPAPTPVKSKKMADAPAEKRAKSETVAARTAVTGFSVADGTETLIDPTLSVVSGNQIKSIADLTGAVERVEQAVSASNIVKAAYQKAIQDYTDGAEVDEAKLPELAKFEATGFSNAPSDANMLPVLDRLLADHLTPATSYADLVGRIKAGESDLETAAADLKKLKRELRAAKPKSRTKVSQDPNAMGSSNTSYDEIDELNADVEVVHEIASDLFSKNYGANLAILNFEVPKLEFATDHPLVPAIDNSFRFYTMVLAEALASMADNDIIWLYGESGCGKSEFWAQLAARLNMPYTRMNLDSHLTRSDIIGAPKLVADGKGGTVTKFIEGILPRAMSRPGLLLLDEFDLADPEVMPVLQPVLEGNPLVLLEDGARIVRPHPLFRIAITGNTIGLGSENQMYLNAFEQSAATRDRITSFVEMSYMPANIEKEVVMARMPDADEGFVDRLIQLANKVREGYRSGEVNTLFSTRAVLTCAKRHCRFAPLYGSPDDAAHEILKTVILARLDSGSREVVKGMVDAIFPH
jgi:cobaltochelatase CobS